MCECCSEQVPDRTGNHIGRPVPVKSLSSEGCFFTARPFTGNGTFALFIPLSTHRRRKGALRLKPSSRPSTGRNLQPGISPFKWASFNKDTCYDFQA